MGLLRCFVEAINKGEPAPLFTGLGTLPSSYKIEVSDDAKPFAIMVPRPVPMPLHTKTKAELQRMKGLGVIEEAEGPTEWCSPCIVVPKGDTVRICSDMTELNKYVKRRTL